MNSSSNHAREAPFNGASDLRVSIVTPSYNQADFLEQTILSVIMQDYPHIEYIIVDGASTDGSVEIIRRYADRLAWWVSEPDRGQAEAINKGMQHAHGEVVAWLNSDDLYLPGAVSRAVEALTANPALGFVFGDAITIDPQGKPLHPLTFGPWALDELIRFRIICQPAVFMRRSKLEQAGYLDPAYHMMLDHHLWIRMAARSPVQYIGGEAVFAPLAAARYHSQAKNAAQPDVFAQETLRVLDWLGTQPDLSKHIARAPRQINGGAYRLVARYLLDGGAYSQALAAYSRALFNWPGYTLKHWHRMLYATGCLAGLGKMLDSWRERASARQRVLLVDQLKRCQRSQPSQSGLTESIGQSASLDLAGWPGICLE